MFNCKFLMKKQQKSVRLTNTVVQLNNATLVDIVASYLHAIRAIKDDRDIVDIEFGLVDQGLIGLTVKSKKGG